MNPTNSNENKTSVEQVVVENTTLGVSVETIVCGVLLLGGLVNLILYLFGKPTIALNEAEIYKWASYAMVVIPAIWGYWHNNSWTKKAQIGDVVKDMVTPDTEMINVEVISTTPIDDLEES